MSPVSITCRPLHHAFVRPCQGTELPHPRYGELFRLGEAGAQAPHQRSVDASGPGDTTPRIMNNKGGEVMPDPKAGGPIAEP